MRSGVVRADTGSLGADLTSINGPPWSIRCRQLVLCPPGTNAQGHGAVSDRSHHRRLWRQQPPRVPCQGATCTAEGRGTRRESADVSGTLVFDERADTQESDPAVDRVVLVLVGASVRHAGHAGGRLGHADRWGLPARRQRDRQRRRRGLGQHLRREQQRSGDDRHPRRYRRSAVHPGVQGHPCHEPELMGRGERSGQGRHPPRLRGALRHQRQ